MRSVIAAAEDSPPDCLKGAKDLYGRFWHSVTAAAEDSGVT